MLMGVVELLLFGILAAGDSTSLVWLNWPIFLAAHALIASVLVDNRLRLTNVSQDFDGEISDLGNKYKSWLRADRVQAGSSGLLALTVWILTRVWILPRFGSGVRTYVVGGFALLSFFGAWKPISDANSERNWIDNFVSTQKPKPETAAA
jgi:hypothetical protein